MLESGTQRPLGLHVRMAQESVFMKNRTYSASIGTTLRARRKLLGLNQTEVAELAGTTQRTVSEAESGKASRLESTGRSPMCSASLWSPPLHLSLPAR